MPLLGTDWVQDPIGFSAGHRLKRVKQRRGGKGGGMRGKKTQREKESEPLLLLDQRPVGFRGKNWLDC